MAVVKNLMVRAGADFSSMRKEMKKAHSDLESFRSNVSRAVKGITAAFAAIGVGSAVKSAVNDAMQFEAAIVQVSRTMGASASEFKAWAKENASAFGMSRLEIMKYGAVYSNLLSAFTSGTAETTQKTQELLKASAVVAAATGRTMEDTMERIRSGLLGNTEAIEDLGINVNVAMIESTRAFQQFANGKSWQQLNFQTQQQIRLMAILEQSYAKYGDQIANTTIARQQQLMAQLKNVRLSLGQAFQPIYNYVLPALIRFATALATVMNYIAQFTTALFGGTVKAQQAQAQATNSQAGAVNNLGSAYKSAGDQATKAGKKAKDAAKKAKNAAGSFDQLNLVGGKTPDSGNDSGGGSSPDGGGVGGGGIGLDEGLFPGMGNGMVEVGEKARAMAEKVREALTKMKDFVVANKDIIIAALAGLATAFAGFWIASKWASIVAAIQSAGKVILGVLSGLFSPVALVVAAIAGLVAAFVYFYRTNETFRDTVQTIFRGIGEVAKWLWESVLVPFGKWLGDVMVKAWEIIGDAAKTLWDNVLKPFGAWLADVLPKAWQAVETAAKWLWKNVLVPFGEFLVYIWKNVVAPLAKVLAEVLGVAFKFVADVAKSFWKNVLVPLGNALKEMFGPAVEAVSAVLSFLWKNVFKPLAAFIGGTVKVVFTELTNVITFLWKNVLKPVAEFVGGIFKSVFSNVFKGIGDVIGGLKTTFIGLMKFITGVFTGDWKMAWEGVKGIFKGVFDALYGIVKVPLNFIIDAINKVIGGLNKINLDMPDWLGGGSFGLNIKEIPRLARGGLAYGPTLAMVGDNKGASSDPEVIAPLSKLEGIMSNGDNRETVGVLTAILQAIKSGQNVNVSISQKDVGRAAINEIKNEQRRTGALPFPV